MDPLKFSGFLLVNLLFCIWIGWLLDSWTGLSPVFLIVLTLYAVIGSFVLLFKKMKK
ncbi:MAG: AtpZ/AtpI family protein [Ileibacterium sp.]|nr:AtpZ/AtpI family protein [Ileibacterium sp.]